MRHGRGVRRGAAAVAAAVVACAFPALAAATDYCVAPNSGCGGTNVATFEQALDLADDADDPDRVFLGAGTYTAPTWTGFDYLSNGEVEIAGQGAGQTILTGHAGGTSWVLRVVGGAGSSVHDLTIRLPQNASAGFAGLHTSGVARRIEVIEDPVQAVRRIGVNLVSGGTLEDSSVTLSDQQDTAAVALLTPVVAVRDSVLGAEVGVESHGGTLERLRVTASDAGVLAYRRLTTVSASLIRLTDGSASGIFAVPAPGANTRLAADGLTIVGPPGPDAIGAGVGTEPAPADDVDISLTNSIIRGVSKALYAGAAGPGRAAISASYSDYDPSGSEQQGAGASITQANVANVGDARFIDAGAGDYRLRPGSPLVDAGDPAAQQGLDLDGHPFVADGDGDGGARRDIGAFELQPAPGGTMAPAGGPAADTRAPLVSGFRAAPALFVVARMRTPLVARVRRGTRFRYTLSEPARVTLTIQHALAGRRSGSRCVPSTRALRRAARCTRYRTRGMLTRTAAGGAASTRFSGRIGRRALRVGRYRALIGATDAAGNRSARRVTSFRVVRG